MKAKRIPFVQRISERVLPWLILGILLLFTYAKFVVSPYVGFEFSTKNVTLVFSPTTENALQVDDHLIRIGDIEVETFLNNLNITFFDDVSIGEKVPIIAERDGKRLFIEWEVAGPTSQEILERFNSLWWLSYVFWVAGMATLLFIRPKDTHWKLLVAFNFLTAIWLVAGSGPSHWHIWYSAIILRSVMWLCVPVYIHLHWNFPKPLLQLPPIVWWLLYSLGISLSVSELFQLLPASLYYSGFLLTIIGCVLILILHAIFRTEHRRDVGLLGLALLLVFLPPMGVALAFVLNLEPSGFVQGGAFLAVPALPGAYFFVAYRQLRELGQRGMRLMRAYLAAIILGTVTVFVFSIISYRTNLADSTLLTGFIVLLISTINAVTGFTPFLILPALAGETVHLRWGGVEIRANRLLSLYLFIVVVGFLASLGIIFLDALWDIPGEATIIGIAAIGLSIFVTIYGYDSFRKFVDRYVLGIQLPPEDLMHAYADRIATQLDRQNLIKMLKNEILPSLLIRQSVLLQKNGDEIDVFLSFGVNDLLIPNEIEFSLWLSQVGSPGPNIESHAWIKLIIPLQVNQDLIGLWFFGRRDPDDRYTQSEISILNSLANQTAIALNNIEQANQLRALTQFNIERHEEERSTLARQLHDDVLGQLAILSMHPTLMTSPEFLESYQIIADHLRRMVMNLRPTMLQFGLFLAFDDFIGDLESRIPEEMMIYLDVPKSNCRYHLKVEEQIFRIVQQALENAALHAKGTQIRLIGRFDESEIYLEIEDDGKGFEIERLDFSNLLAEKHFGLAGMFERAELIDAELKIDSIPGRGTKVIVEWKE